MATIAYSVQTDVLSIYSNRFTLVIVFACRLT